MWGSAQRLKRNRMSVESGQERSARLMKQADRSAIARGCDIDANVGTASRCGEVTGGTGHGEQYVDDTQKSLRRAEERQACVLRAGEARRPFLAV